MFHHLKFRDHHIPGGTIAQHTFDNGWGVSVVAGPPGSGLAGNVGDDTFKVAVIRPSGNMLDEVLNWQTSDEVSAIMRLVSLL